MIRLSIIIPVYKVEKYIGQCLDSVWKNQLSPKDFEVVVVDDESPDKSIEIVEAMSSQFHHFQLIRQKNTGISGARNAGIRAARGERILFIDSDDWIKENSLAKLLELAESQDLDILEFGIEKVSNEGKVLGKMSAGSQGLIQNGIAYYRSVHYVNSVFNKLYRRSLFVDNQILLIEKIYVEDFEVNTRLLMKAQRVMGIPDLVYQYRQSANSITRTSDKSKKTKMLQDHIFVLGETHKIFQQAENNELQFFLGERMSFLVVSIFFYMVKNGYLFSEMKAMKEALIQQGIFHLEHPIHQKNKNLFRKLLQKNFGLLGMIQKLIKT
jgi:glycosyltransferase involved in cell wall biosynthesis